MRQLLLPDARPALQPGQAWVWQIVLAGYAAGALRQQAHGLAAHLLADYCGAAAAATLRLPVGQAPQSSARWQGQAVALSLSYAGPCALVALAVGAKVGVDIVQVQPQPDWQAVARLYLDPTGYASVAAASAALRGQAFAQAWAAMEARSKCLGQPLAEYTAARGAAWQRLAVERLPVAQEYAAALALGKC